MALPQKLGEPEKNCIKRNALFKRSLQAPTSLSLIWLQRNRKIVVLENSKEFRWLHQFCPPSTISDFLARTVSLEMNFHGSYANLHGQVTYVPCLWVWHTSAVLPPSNLSSPPSSWDLLLEHPHTCDHFGCGLDTSVECIYCANPAWVQAHLGLLYNNPCTVWYITQWILKSRTKTLWYMEKGLENKSSTWISLLHLEAHHQVMRHQSGPDFIWLPSLREDEL